MLKTQDASVDLNFRLSLQSQQWGADVVICLQQGANDLHMVQLMPLPPHHLSLQQNPEWFAGLPRMSWKKTVKWM